VIFDVLQLDGESTTVLPYRDRRAILDGLDLRGDPWFVPDTFDDGRRCLPRCARRAWKASSRSAAVSATGR
jgi:hypothetical protein